MSQVQSERFSEDLLQDAIDMANSGATTGMIATRLKKLGVHAELARNVADRAVRQVTQQKRRRGISKLSVGVALVLVGVILLIALQGQPRGSQLAAGFLFFGFLAAVNGIANLVAG